MPGASFNPQSRRTLLIVTELRILPPRGAKPITQLELQWGQEPGKWVLESALLGLQVVPPLLSKTPGGEEVPEMSGGSVCFKCQNLEEKRR